MGRSSVWVDGMSWLHLRDDPPLISGRLLAVDSLFQPQQTSNNSASDFRGLPVYQALVRNGPRLTLVITPPMSSPRVALLISTMESSKSNFLSVQDSILESFTAAPSGNKSLRWSTMGRRLSSMDRTWYMHKCKFKTLVWLRIIHRGAMISWVNYALSSAVLDISVVNWKL